MSSGTEHQAMGAISAADRPRPSHDEPPGILTKLRHYGGLMRRRAREGHCSAWRQLLEMSYLRVRNDVLTSDYFAAGLYRKTFSWPEKKDYLWGKSYMKLVGLFNRRLYGFVIINKIVTNGLLRSFDIPIPPFYGLLNRVDGQTADGRALQTAEDLEALIRRESLEGLCFKPVGGFGGKGFLKVRLQTGDAIMVGLQNEGSFMSLRDFWATRLYDNGGPAYMCQGVVEQHPEVAEIHPESVNTARIWMCQPKRGQWRIYDAALRMGIGAMLVDNTSSGGVTSRINVENGVLGPAIDMTAQRVVRDEHPTTHVRLNGRKLPMWDDVTALALRVCRTFPFLRLLGLDMAFGKDTPLIIEVEATPDPVHQITFDHGIGALLRELAAAGPLDWRR